MKLGAGDEEANQPLQSCSPCSALDSTYPVLDAPVTPLLTCSLVACRLLQVGHVGHASSNREG